MIATFPLASVVIPTHNRVGDLRRTIEALVRQARDPQHYEIVVAANACTDETVDYLRGLTTPCTLRVVDLPGPGAAGARNAGAAAARGAILIFLDDDVTVGPEFVGAHLEAHGLDECSEANSLPLRAAVGYLPAALQPEADFFAIALRGWWEAMFDRMRIPGHRFGYTDLLTGNLSIPREHFTRLGGFDERYRCHEDYEFGYRLIEAGAAFLLVEGAWGLHTDRTRLERACARKREEGRADVQLAVQHPVLRSGLLMARRRSRKQRLIRALAFRAPRIGDRLATASSWLLPILEGVRARATWQRVLYGIFGYWYERGLADAAGTPGALRQLTSATASGEVTDIDLDISDLDCAEARLDRERPDAARLFIGRHVIVSLASEPGRERLAGRHLRPALVRRAHRTYVSALIDEGRLALLGGSCGETRLEQPAGSADTPVALVPGPTSPQPGR